MDKVKTEKKIYFMAKVMIITMLFACVGIFSTFISYSEDISVQTSDLYKKNSYDEYLLKYKNAPEPEEGITVSGDSYSNTDMPVKIFDNYEGSNAKSVLTTEEGFIEWEIEVKEEGLYNIGIKYYPVSGKSSAIERELHIDGKMPFDEARSIIFQRIWKNATGILKDNRGNEINPRQIESPAWSETLFKDLMGYYNEPYKFYFTKGKHTLRLVSVKEPMIIEYLKLSHEKQIPDYKTMEAEYGNKGYNPAKDIFIKVQCEDAVYKSDPTLQPIFDRSSPATEPYDVSKIRLNEFGGYKWSMPGEWAVWEFEVPEDGLYKIALKERQNAVRGIYVTRRMLIDNEVPFKEVDKITFKYDSSWAMKVLGGKEPYLFYFKKGKHQLKLECILGDMSELLRIAEKSVYELNSDYRKIIMITSTIPDPFRDYQLDKRLPGVLKSFEEQSKVLYNLSAQLQAYTGQKGSETAALETLAYQLADLSAKPDTIPKRIEGFKLNVGGLGTWILDIKNQPLELDYFIVASPEKAMPKADASFLGKVLHEFYAFVASFFEDYNSIGNAYSDKKAITVWTGSGRDQAQVLKNMIDDTFTPETGIKVNLNLVQGALLSATVAGKGPDVALEVGNSDPVNYATRNAVVDLSIFPEFDEISQRFRKSSMVPYTFRNGVYALPEKQTFPMLFYRKDIFDQLNLKVPQTWDDVYEILPVLQRNNMNMGIPISDIDSSGGNTGSSLISFSMLLYQNGGKFYKGDGIASDLDSEVAINTFKKWTELYTSYKFPTKYDMANRFRTGELPVGISDYTMYNTLQVFAPEIRGLWEFAPVPGVNQPDGSVRRDVSGGGTACIMLKAAKDKDSAWEFMKWWTSRDTQVRFGREMESLMGAAARHPTANIEALDQLPWPVRDYKSLMAQWEWVQGVPEVPGGYFTGRHLDNALRQVIDDGDDPRETLLDYVLVINKEIDAKRKEFGLK